MDSRQQDWWAPVWRGLVNDPDGKHVRRLDGAVWLLLDLIVHAKRQTGVVWARTETIAKRMGMPRRTVQGWLRRLIKYGYVIPLGRRKTNFVIAKWRPLRGALPPAPGGREIGAGWRQSVRGK